MAAAIPAPFELEINDLAFAPPHINIFFAPYGTYGNFV